MQIWRRFNLAVRSVASAEITVRDEEKRVDGSGLSQVFVSPQGQGLVTSSARTRPVGHRGMLSKHHKEDLYMNINTMRILKNWFSKYRSEEMSNTC